MTALLLYSCAQVVAPTGGKIDRIAPKPMKYQPDSAALNFNSKEILIEFDEFIQLRDLSSQLIISPPLEFQPDVTNKNTTLNIAFNKKEQLKPNTTYSINLGNAIQDIHENNAIENFKYVFSTGTYIDSLVLKGKVESAFDHKTEKGVLVLLYRNTDDSVIYKSMPDYFGKTKEDGTFMIDNIAEGNYKVMALKDANANYKYDSEAESVGFVDTLVNISKNSTINIYTFQQPAKKFFIKNALHGYYGRIIFAFNKPSDSVNIKPLNVTFNEKDIFTETSRNKDSITYWFRNVDKDSLYLQISNGEKVIDTLEFRLIKKADAMKTNRGTPLKFNLVSSPNTNQTFELNGEMAFTFSNPFAPLAVEALKNKEIKMWENDTIPYPESNNLFFEQKTLQSFIIKQKKGNETILPSLKENTRYMIFIPPATFTDAFGFSNDSIYISFKTREEKYYGNLKLKLDLPETSGNYIVQLLDEKENVVRENNIKKSEIINYRYLLPKKYKLKIISDNNVNNKWDTGILQEKQQPEKTIYNVESVEVRSNWDLELEWKVIP